LKIIYQTNAPVSLLLKPVSITFPSDSFSAGVLEMTCHEDEVMWLGQTLWFSHLASLMWLRCTVVWTN